MEEEEVLEESDGYKHISSKSATGYIGVQKDGRPRYKVICAGTHLGTYDTVVAAAVACRKVCQGRLGCKAGD